MAPFWRASSTGYRADFCPLVRSQPIPEISVWICTIYVLYLLCIHLVKGAEVEDLYSSLPPGDNRFFFSFLLRTKIYQHPPPPPPTPLKVFRENLSPLGSNPIWAAVAFSLHDSLKEWLGFFLHVSSRSCVSLAGHTRFQSTIQRAPPRLVCNCTVNWYREFL